MLESFSLEITKDLNLTATFVLKEYTLTLSQNIQGGTVWGGGVYSHGSTASLSATPMNGYRFINWTQDGSILETTNSISLVIESDYAITANFEKLVLTEFAGMKALGDEWYGSDWLGYFFATSTYWIYHLDLGWLYIIPHDEGSIWAWSPKLSWLWLTPSAFSESLAWSRNDNNWIYFYFDDQEDHKPIITEMKNGITFKLNALINLDALTLYVSGETGLRPSSAFLRVVSSA